MSHVVAIIQARMSSSRLRGKVMKPILNKPILWHVVNRTSIAQYVHKTVVATSINQPDDVIVQFCQGNNIPVYRGSENDVLDRYYQCAKEYDAENILRITADCPLTDPQIIDHVIEAFFSGDYDYVTNSLEYSYPEGFDLEVASFEAFQQAWRLSTLPSEREHVTEYIKKHPTEFKIKNVYAEKRYPIYKCSIDYQEDYEFVKQIFESLGRDVFLLDDVASLLQRRPELLAINQHKKENKEFLRLKKNVFTK
jgi:spore coat polysaccharide biosynthesis protein SpsF